MDIIDIALKEDKVKRDISSLIVPRDLKKKAFIIFKEKGIFCGGRIVKEVFKRVDKSIKVKILKKDGEIVKKGEKVIKLYGNVRSILRGERVALNFLQHLSGIATITKKFVKRAGKIKVYDTRKTIPGLRDLQKYAVRCGGGKNHRMNLEDAVMIKDNHWIFWKGEKNIFFKLKKYKWKNKKIIIELDSLRKLKKVIQFKPDVIMLDNFSVNNLKKAIKIIRENLPETEIEVSGRIDFKKMERLRNFDIDRVSIGFITHSVKAIDISLEFA